MTTPTLFQADDRWRQLRRLTEISRALTYAMSLEDVLDLAVNRAAELLGAEKAVVMLTNDDGLLSIRASYGLDTETCARFREPLQETVFARLQGLLGGAGSQRFLGVPLVVGGEVTGLLAVARPGGEGDPDQDEWLLSALADQAAVALEKTRLDETAKFREKLIGIVSHDLRNPIAAISMATQALLELDELSARTTKTVVLIHMAAARATRMIKDLLDYTQARLGGRIRVDPRPANIHTIVRQVVDELELAYEGRRIAVVQHGDGQGAWDPDRLAQVVSNLLSNALQYSPAEAPVRVETRESDSWITLVVHNEGSTIPSARLPYIFEPLQRATAEWSAARRSVGLGLFIVRHIVEAHRGEVSVESSEQAGTTFTVRLPRHAVVA